MAFGIDVGPSGQEGQQYQNLSGLSSTEAGMGLNDLTQSTDFMSAILSGDPAKIGQVLGPQIQGIQGQGTQSLQTASQFGNRGGGTNAQAQQTTDNTRTQTNNLISSLTGTAASGLNSTGLSLTGNAQSGFGTSFDQASTMQNQRAAMFNDLFSSIGNTVSGAVAGGFGA
jgi:hypothetical protein